MQKIYPRLFQKLFRMPLMLDAAARASFENYLIGGLADRSAGIAHEQLVGSPGPITQHMAEGDQQPKKRCYGQGPSGRYDADFEDWEDYSKHSQDSREKMRVESIYRKFGKVAVVKIEGVIDKAISQFEMDCYGGCDLADVDQALGDAEEDESITDLVTYINTPGGSVIGTPETAARIARIAAKKNVVAFVPVQCCSAGYYIASQARRIVAAPSAILGSIGVYCAVLDASRAYEMEGYAVQLMKAGKFKAMGAEWKPLSEEEKALLQKGVDETYARFTAAVTSNRPRVSTETMQGQSFDGIEAEDRWLVDELTGETLDEFVSRLLLS